MCHCCPAWQTSLLFVVYIVCKVERFVLTNERKIIFYLIISDNIMKIQTSLYKYKQTQTSVKKLCSEALI